MSSEETEVTPLVTAPNKAAHSGFTSTTWVLFLLALYFAVFLAALDSTVVATLLSHIASELHELDNISWVASAYLIAFSAFQPLYGKLSDIYGRRTVMVTGMALFGIGCQLCSMGSTIAPLIAGRFVSGVGGGAVLSMSSVSMSDFIPLRKRGIYQGFGNIAFGVGAAAGGMFGSAIAPYGWRLAFSLQVPVILLAVLILAYVLPNKKADPNEIMTGDNADHPVKRNSLERLDIVGAFTLTGSVLLLMVALTTGGQRYPWVSPFILGSFGFSALFIAFFFYWEANVAVEPVMPLNLVLRRPVLAQLFTNGFSSAAMYICFYYVPIMLSAIFNYDYHDLGKLNAIQFIAVANGSLCVGVIMRRTGKHYWLGLGATIGLLVAALIFLSTPLLADSVGSSFIYQISTYILLGLSYSAILTVSLVALIASVPQVYQATVTSAQYTFRGAGSSIGVALAASIFHNVLKIQLYEHVHGKGANKAIKAVLKSVEAIREVPDQFRAPIIKCFNHAAIAVFALCAVLSVGAVISSALADEHSLDGRGDPQAPTRPSQDV